MQIGVSELRILIFPISVNHPKIPLNRTRIL